MKADEEGNRQDVDITMEEQARITPVKSNVQDDDEEKMLVESNARMHGGTSIPDLSQRPGERAPIFSPELYKEDKSFPVDLLTFSMKSVTSNSDAFRNSLNPSSEKTSAASANRMGHGGKTSSKRQRSAKERKYKPKLKAQSEKRALDNIGTEEVARMKPVKSKIPEIIVLSSDDEEEILPVQSSYVWDLVWQYEKIYDEWVTFSDEFNLRLNKAVKENKIYEILPSSSCGEEIIVNFEKMEQIEGSRSVQKVRCFLPFKSEFVLWQFRDAFAWWNCFKPSLCCSLEIAHNKKKKNFQYSDDTSNYMVYLKKNVRVNQDDMTSDVIERVTFDFPTTAGLKEICIQSELALQQACSNGVPKAKRIRLDSSDTDIKGKINLSTSSFNPFNVADSENVGTKQLSDSVPVDPECPGSENYLHMDLNPVEKSLVKDTESGVKSKLDSKLQSLLELICDQKRMEEIMSQNSKEIPLGILTLRQVEDGYIALKKIADILSTYKQNLQNGKAKMIRLDSSDTDIKGKINLPTSSFNPFNVADSENVDTKQSFDSVPVDPEFPGSENYLHMGLNPVEKSLPCIVCEGENDHLPMDPSPVEKSLV